MGDYGLETVIDSFGRALLDKELKKKDKPFGIQRALQNAL